MLFKITDPVDVPLNHYVVEVNTYQGDADGDSVFIAGPFAKGEDEEALESVIETLERIKENFAWGQPRKYGKYHSDVPGFLQWFDSNYGRAEDVKECRPALYRSSDVEAMESMFRLSNQWYQDWPMDHLANSVLRDEDDTIYESLKSYHVFFYDSEGRKFNVTVE